MNHSVSQWGVRWNSNHSSIRYKWLTGAFRLCLEIESLYAQVKLRWEACKWWWSKSKRVVCFLSCWHWEGNNQCHIITYGLLTATHSPHVVYCTSGTRQGLLGYQFSLKTRIPERFRLVIKWHVTRSKLTWSMNSEKALKKTKIKCSSINNGK